jgi:hypothetical protein
MTQDQVKITADLMVKALGVKGSASVTTMPGPGGKPADTIAFGGEDGSMLMSQLGCGVRQVLVATVGVRMPRRLHERILASFECRPDPAQEGSAKLTVPLVLDLPGWHLAAREPDLVQITDGATAQLTMRPLPPGLKIDLEMMIEPIFKAAGVQGRVTKRDGDRISITMSDGSDSLDGWVRLVPCPTGTTMVLALAADQATLDRIYERVGGARCLRPGEKPQEWPAPPPGAPVGP